jgi:hypothetical protein
MLQVPAEPIETPAHEHIELGRRASVTSRSSAGRRSFGCSIGTGTSAIRKSGAPSRSPPTISRRRNNRGPQMWPQRRINRRQDRNGDDRSKSRGVNDFNGVRPQRDSLHCNLTVPLKGVLPRRAA